MLYRYYFIVDKNGVVKFGTPQYYDFAYTPERKWLWDKHSIRKLLLVRNLDIDPMLYDKLPIEMRIALIYGLDDLRRENIKRYKISL